MILLLYCDCASLCSTTHIGAHSLFHLLFKASCTENQFFIMLCLEQHKVELIAGDSVV